MKGESRKKASYIESVRSREKPNYARHTPPLPAVAHSIHWLNATGT